MNNNFKQFKYKVLNNTREIIICEQEFDYKLGNWYYVIIDAILSNIHENYINLLKLPLPRFIIRPDAFLDDTGILCKGEYTVFPFIEDNCKYTIITSINMIENEFIGNMIHEFGHHIHYIIYDYKRIQWYKEDLSEYGKTNNREAFAETFCELVGNINNKNTRKMQKLFNKI